MPMGKLVLGAPKRPLNSRQVKQVGRLINKQKQLKHVYIDQVQTLGTTATFKEITTTSEGTGISLRDSDKIFLQSLRAQWTISSAATPVAAQVRVMIVRGRNGPLVVGDMPAITAAPDYSKMQVLFDTRLGYPDADFDPMRYSYFKSFKNKKVPHLKVRYEGSDTAASGNPIYMYTIASSAANVGTLHGWSKIKFFD